MIELKPLSLDNFDACLHLDVRKDQKSFVAPNMYSIAESKVCSEWTPLVITLQDQPIGFLLFGIDLDDGYPWLIRFMLDAAYQGKGYGKEAMRLTLKMMYEKYGAVELRLSTEPENAHAIRFYEAFGFENTGIIVGDEVLMIRSAVKVACE